MGQIDRHRKTSQSVYEALWEMAKHARELEVKLVKQDSSENVPSSAKRQNTLKRK